MVELICEQCSKVFYVEKTRMKNENPKYCSRKCYSGNRKPRIACLCIGCNKTIYRTARQIERGLKRYCTEECFKKYGKAKSVELECICCHKKFERSIGQHNHAIKMKLAGPFCGINCSAKYLKHGAPKIGQDIIDGMLDLHYSGKNKQEIADAYNIKLGTLNLRFKNANISIPWSIYEENKPYPRGKSISVCKNCHKEFAHKSSHPKIYCTRACYTKTRTVKLQKPCPTCKKEFTINHNEKRPDKVYCSEKCREEKRKRNSKVVTTCLSCGNSFKEYQSVLDRGYGKYCSVKCKYINTLGSKMTFKCDYCGKSFERRPSSIRFNKNVFCGRTCANAGHKINMDKKRLEEGGKLYFGNNVKLVKS